MAAGPVVAATASSLEPALTVPLSIGEPSMRATTWPEPRHADPDHRVAREGWFCPIGTCGPRPGSSTIRTAISFGMAAGVAGLIARRRSDRPA